MKIRELSCSIPRPPDFIVRLDVLMKVFKTQLLKENNQKLLVTAYRGFGKATLVKILGHDPENKGICFCLFFFFFFLLVCVILIYY